VTTMSTTPENRAERVNLRRWLPAAVVTIVAAVVANVLVLLLLKAILPLPEGFNPLLVGSVVFFSVLGTVAASIVFAIVAKLSRRPFHTYRVVAVVALILSIIPNFAAMANPAMFPFPGGSALAFGVLILFHVIAAVISVVVLTRMTREVGAAP
jgi:hypothetical protein